VVISNVNIAVVTGGGHGIGRAVCRRLARDGAIVAVADVDADAAARVAEEIGGQAFLVDVGSQEEVDALVEDVERRTGSIDLFVSNAGVAFGDADGQAASAAGGAIDTADRWDACWRVNVMAHVYAARALVPRMTARGGGYLVNIASAAGLLAQIGDAAYTATKHAAVGFAESLAITHGDEGIRVAVVCPQAVATRMIGMPDDAEVAGGGFGGNEVDGILSAEDVADCIVEGLAEGRFLILPHAKVSTYCQRKAADHDRWIQGMQRFRRRLSGEGQ
jgi:NAD(P)-dependent dehydrogenase (short-subunit alcohol dehydrogenase family)